MTAIVVIGFHRSGTSLVASMLEAMGVNMGDRLMEASVHNPHGHFEDLDVYNLNRLILQDAGGDWARPPSPGAVAGAGKRLRDAIGEIVRRKERGDLWGWKDPRTCLTASLYHPHLADEITTHRTDYTVDKSLGEEEHADVSGVQNPSSV